MDAAALLGAWEAGAAEAVVDRAPSLLCSLGWVTSPAEAGELTVGECDARVFRVRRALFGETLEATSVCPGCSEELEFELSLAALQPDSEAERPLELHVSEHGFEIACRPLRNCDLPALAQLGAAATAADALERCVIAAREPEGEELDARDLPPAVGEAVLHAVAASDPGAHVAVEVRCSCGAAWTDELDIREVIWTELTDWVSRTLTEVHALAQAYGWSEAEVLGLSEWRRRWYLEAAGC